MHTLPISEKSAYSLDAHVADFGEIGLLSRCTRCRFRRNRPTLLMHTLPISEKSAYWLDALERLLRAIDKVFDGFVAVIVWVEVGIGRVGIESMTRLPLIR